MTDQTTTAAIRQTSARMRGFMTALVISLAVLLVLERFGSLAAEALRGGWIWRRVALQAVSAMPEVLYLLALVWVRQALAAFASGDLYTPTIARMVDRVGTTLAAGALVGVFLVPSALRLLGQGPGYLIAYDIAGLVLGAVGLSLKVIAHVLRRAAELQAELDEMF
jgi:hypothetical protein